MERINLELEQEVIADLSTELRLTDANFSKELLVPKVKNAIREVQQNRNYPDDYTVEQIETDMYKFYSNIRDIALYDYNQIGNDFQKSSSENSISRTWVDRKSLFNGIYPFVSTLK